MNLLQRLEHWGDSHHPKWLVLVRIALGVFLIIKGIEFLNDTSIAMSLMSSKFSFGSFTLLLLSHYIALAHIGGGFLITLGMLTRIACIVQIPVLLGAVFFINAPEGLWSPFSELGISILVLLLLIYFLIIGDGPWSFDWFAKREKKEAGQ